MGEGSGVIVSEDDVFTTADAVASSEDPVTVLRSLQEGQLRRSRREGRPRVRTRDLRMDTLWLFLTFQADHSNLAT